MWKMNLFFPILMKKNHFSIEIGWENDFYLLWTGRKKRKDKNKFERNLIRNKKRKKRRKENVHISLLFIFSPRYLIYSVDSPSFTQQINFFTYFSFFFFFLVVLLVFVVLFLFFCPVCIAKNKIWFQLHEIKWPKTDFRDCMYYVKKKSFTQTSIFSSEIYKEIKIMLTNSEERAIHSENKYKIKTNKN